MVPKTSYLSSYAERYLPPGEAIPSGLRDRLAQRPVFLPRALKSYSKSPFGRQLVEKVGNISHTSPSTKDVKKESKDEGEKYEDEGDKKEEEDEEEGVVKQEDDQQDSNDADAK